MGQAELQKVLVIDDERVIATTLAKIFSKWNYEARPVYSAEEALELIFRDGWCPDLAVIDVNLPGMNGVELGVLMKDKCAECQIVLLSGEPDTEEILDRAQQTGHTFHVLGKPVPPAEFLSLASRLLSEEHTRRSTHKAEGALSAGGGREDSLVLGSFPEWSLSPSG